MADGINEVRLLGNVGQAPEVRTTQNGMKIANFSLATSRSYKKDGVRHERTEWHRIVVMNPHIVPTVENYVRKGSRVFVGGELRTRKWTDNNGIERFTTEVVVDFEGKVSLQDIGNGNRQQQGGGAGQAGAAGSNEPPPENGEQYTDPTGWMPPDDEIPI